MSSFEIKSYWILTTEMSKKPGGGIGTYVREWTQALAGDYKVTIFFMNPACSGLEEEVDGSARVIQFPPDYAGHASCLGYEAMVSLAFDRVVSEYIAKEGVPYCLESQDYQGIAYFIMQKKCLGYPEYTHLTVLIQCHCPSFILLKYNHAGMFRLPYYWIGEMEKFCIRAADVCVSPSQYLVDELEKEEPALARDFHVIRNPYQLSPKRQRNSSLPRQRERTALVVAKLSPLKGIGDLAKALTGLSWDEFPLRVEIAGDRDFFYHPAGKTFERYMREKYPALFDADRFRLLGMLDGSTLQAKTEEADVLLAPSRFDTFPYSVIEAMGAEVPVLTSDTGGQGEILEDGISGIISSSGDVEKLRADLQRIQRMSDSERSIMGQRARAAVAAYCTPSLIVAQKMDLIAAHKSSPQRISSFPFLRVESTSYYDEKKPGISVVIPYFEMGDFLSEALESVFNSTLEVDEIIIVDDGSTRQPASSYLGHYQESGKIKLVTQPNRGLPLARNSGAREARFPYLAFLDPDDTVHPTYYQKAVRTMQLNRNVHFVGCWTNYFGDASGTWPAFTPEPPYLLYHNMVNSSSLVFRRESWMSAGQNCPDMLFGMEDYESVVSMTASSFAGVVLPEVLFNYRVRKQSMARDFNKANLIYSFERISARHDVLFKKFGRELAALCMANGPGFDIDNPTLDYQYGNNKRARRLLIRLIKRNKTLKRLALAIHRIKF